MLRELIVSGRIADIILAVMALEAVAILGLMRPRTPTTIIALAGNLIGGAGLVLALRAALTGAEWPWIAGSLLLSMAGHVADLATRSWSR